jgi:hypothetical protein
MRYNSVDRGAVTSSESRFLNFDYEGGSSIEGSAQRQLEKKRAYAAELQNQMALKRELNNRNHAAERSAIVVVNTSQTIEDQFKL